MKKLSLVMIVKNEERCLERCLKSAKPYVDEIIIVDTGSIDRTIEIAEKFDSKIFHYEWNSDFSDARNFAIRQSTGDFNLILDADEYIVNFDEKSFGNYLNNSEFVGRIKIINLFESDNIKKREVSTLSRIAPKNTFFEGAIHEQFSLKIPRIFVDITIEHDGYLIDNGNKFERNLKIILRELEDKPDSKYLNYQAAQTYFTDKNYEKASVYFDKYISIANFEKDAYYKIAVLNAIYNSIKINDYEKYLKVIDVNFDLLGNECDFWFACAVFFTNLTAFDTEKYIHFIENIPLCYQKALEIGEPKEFQGVIGTGTFLAAENLANFYDVIGKVESAIKYRKLSRQFIENN